MSRSSNASRYGSLAEKRAAEKYGLRLGGVHTSWCDAEFGNGKPVEIKSAMHRRANGSPGRFRLFRTYHDRLLEADGYYCFVVYRIRGRGIEVLRTLMTKASRLPSTTWYGAGGHRSNQQTKLRIDTVF
jgi:hypothetical protein